MLTSRNAELRVGVMMTHRHAWDTKRPSVIRHACPNRSPNEQNNVVSKHVLDHASHAGTDWLCHPCPLTPVYFIVNKVKTEKLFCHVSQLLRKAQTVMSVRPFDHPELEGCYSMNGGLERLSHASSLSGSNGSSSRVLCGGISLFIYVLLLKPMLLALLTLILVIILILMLILVLILLLIIMILAVLLIVILPSR